MRQRIFSQEVSFTSISSQPRSPCTPILKISSTIRQKIRYQQIVSVCLICLVVVGGVYYNYPRYFHDNKATLDVEDVRFPLFQWQSAGYFVKNYTGGNTIWGDKIAFDYVGGYGERNLLEPDTTLNITLAQWTSTYPSTGDVVILRKSMTTVPYANYVVTPSGIHEILITHNVIYSSGEVVMVVES